MKRTIFILAWIIIILGLLTATSIVCNAQSTIVVVKTKNSYGFFSVPIEEAENYPIGENISYLELFEVSDKKLIKLLGLKPKQVQNLINIAPTDLKSERSKYRNFLHRDYGKFKTGVVIRHKNIQK